MADETKAANHIDFTSVPYAGPSLVKGQAILAEEREKTKDESTSLQKGWYYSGQLDQRVIWEKGARPRPPPGVPSRLPRPPPARPTPGGGACRNLPAETLPPRLRPSPVPRVDSRCRARPDRNSTTKGNPMYKTSNSIFGQHDPPLAEVRPPPPSLPRSLFRSADWG
eukprot:COSAG04_NODE_18_length_39571_cov_50.788128_30_plen_166_part_01